MSSPPDRAAVLTTAIIQIIQMAISRSRDEIESYLRDELADVKREAADDIRLTD